MCIRDSITPSAHALFTGRTKSPQRSWSQEMSRIQKTCQNAIALLRKQITVTLMILNAISRMTWMDSGNALDQRILLLEPILSGRPSAPLSSSGNQALLDLSEWTRYHAHLPGD